ncbi:MAG: fumarate/nitrate reduction transcriptional regulator Fnr [Pseudomonadota bacterium]
MKYSDIKVSCADCSLSELCLPRGLNEAELHELDNAIEHKYKCDRDAYLYRNGDELHAIYAVRSGSFKATATTAEGVEQVVGFYLPGELLGLDAFADHKHTCNVVALESSTVCELPFPEFETLCGQLSGLRKQLMHLVGREITSGNRMLLALGQMTAEERLATFLMSLSKRFEDRGFSTTDFNLSMPRHDLANYIGIAVETVSRLFARMQKEGLIEVDRRKISILDIDRLSALAHERCLPAEIPLASSTH